jgi:hypothetical protein
MNSFMYAASGRDMEVVVAGNPFTMSKNEVDRVVVDSMQGQNNGPLTHFTLSPGQDSKLGYRIVVALNPPASFPAADACTSNPGTIPTTPTGGRLRALMAFCAKDSILSEATGSVVPVARPTDGDFGPLMAALIRDLVPAREPNDDSQSVIVGMK